MPQHAEGDRERFPYHRRFVRHKVRLKVEVKDDQGFQSWTNNLSEDGVCFEIPPRIKVGNDVVVWVYVSRDKGVKPVKADCRVVWHDKGKKGYRHGGQFTGFEGDDRQRLLDFLKEISRPITQPPPP